jgi:poly(3-hydroxybutyrate) depolymerase
VNDIQFTLDIIRYVEERYLIDTKRIYAAGKSNGGGFVNLLACDPQASALIAAFGPVSGAFYLQANGNPPPCNPSRSPVPVMEFHGWRDKTIEYEGGENTRGDASTAAIPSWLDAWAIRDGCVPSGNTTSTLCSKQKPVIRYAWNCLGVPDALVHYNISNLKHVWPSINGNADSNETTCFDATTLLMAFFEAHPLK